MTLTTTREMVATEILRVRRNRPMMAFAITLSIGVMVLAFGYQVIVHATDPAHNGPAGGMHAWNHVVPMLGFYFGALASILIGAEVGTADLSSGVFRDLVATGRSRLALFLVRVPAAVTVSLTLIGISFALALAATFAFAGGQPTPDLTLILQSAGWVVLANVALATLAVGVGSLSGSRPVTLTAVIGWYTIASSLILSIHSLGAVRDGVLSAALGQLSPVTVDGPRVTMAVATAVVVIAAWLAVPLLLGAWRSQTQDA